MRKLFSIPNARLYIGGQVVSLFGDTSMWLAMGIWVKSLTGSSSAAGLVFFAFGAPQLLGPVAGVYIDRFRRRPILIATNLSLAGIVLLLLLVRGRDQVWLIYAVMVLYGASYNVLGSAGSALLSTILPDDALAYGNAALSTAREGLRLVAPLVGAGLFVLVGGGWVAAVDACTFLAAAMSLIMIKVEEERPAPSEKHWLAESAAGVKHIVNTVVLRQLTLATSVAIFVVGFDETLAFAVVSQGLHRPPAFLGVLLAIQGIGGLTGGVTAAPLLKRIGEGPLCGIGLLAFASGTVMLVSSSLAVVAPGLVICGLGLPWIIVGLTTVFQRLTPSNLQGRTFAALDVLIGLPQTVSIALGAVLLVIVDYRLLLIAITGVVGVTAIYVLTRKEQWARRSRPGDVDEGLTSGSTGPEMSTVAVVEQV